MVANMTNVTVAGPSSWRLQAASEKVSEIGGLAISGSFLMKTIPLN
jgi:hypothetical protein